MVLGVDPGGETTGLCLCDGPNVADWRLVERNTDTIECYLRRVVGLMSDREWMIAVEDLNAPNPHLGLTSVRGLLDTAMVIGAIRATCDAVMVRPGRHGKRPLSEYPSELVGPRESKGSGIMRHVRSAYDIAQTAQ